MAGNIVQSMTNSFKTDILSGVHAFGTSVLRANTFADQFRIALYDSNAVLTAGTTQYTNINEVPSSGTYVRNTASQNLVISNTPTLGNASTSGGTAYLSFNNITWTGATISANGALIYNYTQSEKSVAVLDFGGTKSSTAGAFQIQFPPATYSAAIIRIG